MLVPSLLATATFAAFLLATGRRAPDPTSAYAASGSPLHLLASVSTYVVWTFDLVRPVPDVIAAPESGAWPLALAVLVVIALAARFASGRSRSLALAGGVWWLAFLLPVLPLVSHSYVYYLYVPMAGASLAVAALAAGLGGRLPAPARRAAAVVALLAYAIVCGRQVGARERVTRDALPVDRTMRDATLLERALHDLEKARLPRGTEIGFVNPVPRRRFDLLTGRPTAAADTSLRTSYYPIDAAMRGGETIRIFLPGLVYRGFRETIPDDWTNVEVFLPDQRGWLTSWGRGRRALERQAEEQARAGQQAAAESTLARARALGSGELRPASRGGPAPATGEAGVGR